MALKPKLKVELLEILKYFKEGLEDIESGSEESEPMVQRLKNVIEQLNDTPIYTVVNFKQNLTCNVKNFEYIIKSLSLRKTQKNIANELNLSTSAIENRIKKIKKHYKVKTINELLELNLKSK